MVLAAGKGERMLPLTLETPKPLLAAGGKALIQHHLENLAANGFTDLVINHAWLGEQIEAALGDGSDFGVKIAWSREEEPLETAGGIIQALPRLGDEAFACVNADIWTDYAFSKLSALDSQDGVDGENLLAWLVMVENPIEHPQGDFALHEGKVSEPSGDEKAFTYSGIAVYHPALFAGLSQGKQSVVPLLKQAMANGKVGGELYQGSWFDIGTPERLLELNNFLNK